MKKTGRVIGKIIGILAVLVIAALSIMARPLWLPDDTALYYHYDQTTEQFSIIAISPEDHTLTVIEAVMPAEYEDRKSQVTEYELNGNSPALQFGGFYLRLDSIIPLRKGHSGYNVDYINMKCTYAGAYNCSVGNIKVGERIRDRMFINEDGLILGDMKYKRVRSGGDDYLSEAALIHVQQATFDLMLQQMYQISGQ